jgi:uridine kinase
VTPHPGRSVRTLSALASALSSRRDSPGPLLVGIDGPGGSGKSTLARALAPRLSATVVEGDDFYQPSSQRDARTVDADGIGAGFDWERLRDQVLAPARSGSSTRYQRYDWDKDHLDQWRSLDRPAVVIVEGVYVTRDELRRYFSATLWVEAPYKTRLARGLERGASRRLWVEQWMPAEDRYRQRMQPQSRADLVVDGSGTPERDPEAEVVIAADRLGLAPEDGPRRALPSVPDLRPRR